MDNCPASDFFKCQVGCGICVKDNTVVAGGITVGGKMDYEPVLQGVAKDIDVELLVDSRSSDDSKRL